jgi:hypothetical protein
MEELSRPSENERVNRKSGRVPSSRFVGIVMRAKQWVLSQSQGLQYSNFGRLGGPLFWRVKAAWDFYIPRCKVSDC